MKNNTIYPNRYQAEKIRRKGEEAVVKVTNGYMIMTYDEYVTWLLQK